MSDIKDKQHYNYISLFKMYSTVLPFKYPTYFSETMSAESFSMYIQVLQRLLPTLPASRNLDDDDSDSEEDMDYAANVRYNKH
jgi:hypothetical protein